MNWRKLSKTYKEIQNNKCERCGDIHSKDKITHHKIHIDSSNINNTSVLLNMDNLELLCRDCHNKEHFAKDKSIDYAFDDEGQLVSHKVNIPPVV